MKVQMYINPDKDDKLHDFLENIENEAPNERGYLVYKIKAILNAWSSLTDIYGEKDVVRLALQLASNTAVKQSPKPVKEEKSAAGLPKDFGMALYNAAKKKSENGH